MVLVSLGYGDAEGGEVGEGQGTGCLLGPVLLSPRRANIVKSGLWETDGGGGSRGGGGVVSRVFVELVFFLRPPVHVTAETYC